MKRKHRAISDGLHTCYMFSTQVYWGEPDYNWRSWDVPGIVKSESVKALKRKGVKVRKIKLRRMRKRDLRGYMVPALVSPLDAR